MEAAIEVHEAELGSSGRECRCKKCQDKDTTTKEMWLMDLDLKKKETKPDKHIIYKVPVDLFKLNESAKGCFHPKKVHLGPYNWSKNEKDMLDRKRSMANKFISCKTIQKQLRGEIHSNIETLRKAFCREATAAMEPETWEEMLFLDGCFVLYFIFCIMYNRAGDLEMERYKIDLVHNDLFLLENQLPYELLKILSRNDPMLHPLIHEYICNHKLGNHIGEVLGREDKPPVHLLDCLRTIIIGRGSEPKNNCISHATWSRWRRRRLGLPPSTAPPQLPLSTALQWPSSATKPTQASKNWAILRNEIHTTKKPSQASKKWTVLRHAKELTTRGIHLKPNWSGFVRDIFFHSNFIYGTLRLPRMVVDSSTNILFLNMAAYEMCAGKESVIISYICFLDLLVNHAEDIKELQSAGILVNKLSTDEDAAKLFNAMSVGLRPEPDIYVDVKKKMQRFFENKAKASLASWIAEGYHNQFRSPLTAMAVLAAFIALCLTAIQTYFTIFH